MESRRDGPQLSMRHDDNDDDVSVKSLQGPLNGWLKTVIGN